MSRFCRKPWTGLVVGWDGNATMCCAMPRPETILGNLITQSFEEVWNGPMARRLRYQMLSEPDPPACRFCTIDVRGSGITRDLRCSPGPLKIERVRILDQENRPIRLIHPDAPFRILVSYKTDRPVDDPVFGVALGRNPDRPLLELNTALDGRSLGTLSGTGCLGVEIRTLPVEGVYFLSVAIHHRSGEPYDFSTAHLSLAPGRSALKAEPLHRWLLD